MGHDGRERSFEKALAQQLRLGATNDAQNAACPDTEILAAYHERNLSLEELATWKTHIAACDRCQEILASLEITENIPVASGEEIFAKESISGARAPDLETTPRVVRELPMAAARAPMQAQPSISPSQAAAAKVATIPPPKPHWRWTAPIGAIAAGLLVWVVLHENKSTQVPSPPAVQVADNRDQSASPVPAEPRAETSTLKKAAPPKETSKYLEAAPSSRAKGFANPKPNLPSKDSKQAAAPAPPDLVASASPAAPQPSTSSGALTDSKRKSVSNLPSYGRNTLGGRVLATPAPRPAAPSTAGAAKARVATPPPAPGGSSADSAASASATHAPPAPAAQSDADKPPKSVTETVTVVGAAPPVTTAVEVSNNQLQTLDRSSSAQLLAVLPGPPGTISISAPGGRTFWRVGLQGAVERTDDTGKSWKPQKSGVTADFIAGSAPSKKICWLLGRHGTVLSTKDGGKHWRKLASPVDAELASVRATDELTALVSDVAGRTFQTADGGKTWTPVNKQ